MSEIERHGAITVIRPTASLTGDYVATLEDQVTECLSGGIPMVIVDMANTGLIDGKGLEWLLDFDEACSMRGGSVRLTGVIELCQDILRVTGVSKAVAQYDSLTQALASFT